MAADNSTSHPRGPGPQLTVADIVIITVYFALNVAVGIWSSCRASRNTVRGYFLASRDMTWWPIGASLFASSEGSGLFIGLAGSGAAGGLAVAGFEWNATYVLLALAWVFVPIYVSSEIVTMPEYIQKRYGGWRIRMYLSVLSLLLSVFTKISMDLYAGALFVHICLGWDFYLCTVLMLAITALYTIAGGLAAVIYTDALQTLIMVVGAVILTVRAFQQIGGYEQLAAAYARAVPSRTISNTTCHLPRADAMHMFRDPYTGDLPWTGMTFGLTIMATWYWCTDQVIVQRSLSARDLNHAKGGSILASYLKMLPMGLIVMPGMVSRVLFPDDVGCVVPSECLRACGAEIGCSNIAYPKLVMELMPTEPARKGRPCACRGGHTQEVSGQPRPWASAPCPGHGLQAEVPPSPLPRPTPEFFLQPAVRPWATLFPSLSFHPPHLSNEVWVRRCSVRWELSRNEKLRTAPAAGETMTPKTLVASRPPHSCPQLWRRGLSPSTSNTLSLLPPGPLLARTCLRGLMIAVMMAALMSSLTSIFNSSSALFTMDIWRRLRPQAGERELLLVGRLVIIVLVGVSVAWIPVLQGSNSGQLFIYMQSVTSSLAPPVTAIFVLGIFWRRANEQGAFWGLMAGLAAGAARLVLEFLHPALPCGRPDTRPAILGSIHYLHFAIALFVLSAAVVVAGSLLTPPPQSVQIENLTWWTLAQDLPSGAKTGDGQAAQKHAFWARVCGVNAILLVCVNIFLYAYFA